MEKGGLFFDFIDLTDIKIVFWEFVASVFVLLRNLSSCLVFFRILKEVMEL